MFYIISPLYKPSPYIGENDDDDDDDDDDDVWCLVVFMYLTGFAQAATKHWQQFLVRAMIDWLISRYSMGG